MGTPNGKNSSLCPVKGGTIIEELNYAARQEIEDKNRNRCWDDPPDSISNTSGAVAILGVAVALTGAGFFIWGCMNYAQGKGHSKWFGLLGLFRCIGLITLILLPDRHKAGA